MTGKPPADPRLLLPEWLRDGDLKTEGMTNRSESTVDTVDRQQAPNQVQVIHDPYSDRLTIDEMLDPRSLVSERDLPAWLGSLSIGRTEPSHADRRPPASSPPATQPGARPVSDRAPEPVATPAMDRSLVETPVEAPELTDDAVDPNPTNVVDVTLAGWQLAAVAIGLLVLLAAALRLYLT